jgi:hypothetical protein
VGNSTAIEDASATLIDVLEEGIDIQGVNVVVSSPDEVTGDGPPTVGLFLYDVTPNIHESPVVREEINPEQVQPGALVVDLHYLLTAYPSGGGGRSKQTMRQHSLLGQAMRTLRDEAVIRGSRLRGSLEETLRIDFGDDDETITDIWNTFTDTAYLASVTYTVGPVSLGAGEVEDADRVTSITRQGSDG